MSDLVALSLSACMNWVVLLGPPYFAPYFAHPLIIFFLSRKFGFSLLYSVSYHSTEEEAQLTGTGIQCGELFEKVDKKSRFLYTLASGASLRTQVLQARAKLTLK